MAEETLTITIDDSGRISVDTVAGLRRLAMRPGKYRLVPSGTNLVIFERADDKARGSSSARIVLSGEIERLGGLVEVIQFIGTSGWSGQLAVLSGQARKTIYFRRGDVSTAASNLPEDKFGALLNRYGKITPTELDDTLARMSQESRLGQTLVEMGKLSAPELYHFVRLQVEEIFFSVLALRSGEYYFYRSDDSAGPRSQISLPTKSLLFDGVRRIDEMAYFRTVFPSSDSVVYKLRQAPPGTMGPAEAQVFALVDGERTIKGIARESHLGEFEATKILYGLHHAGFVSAKAAEPLPPPPTGPVDAATLVGRYNRAFALIGNVVAGQGRFAVLETSLRSFFESMTSFAPLFVGIGVNPDGTLPEELLLANLEMAPTDDKLGYLRRGLDELLRFARFLAAEAGDRAAELALGEQIDAILNAA